MEIFWDDQNAVSWDAKLALAGHAPLQQCWEYGASVEACGGRVHRARITEFGRDIAIVQLLERRGFRAISRGPIWLENVPEATKRTVLRRLSHHRGLTFATTNDAASGFGFIPLISTRHHALWSLIPDPEGLRNGLHGKWRNRLRQAEKRVMPSISDTPHITEKLITAELAQRKERGYRAVSPDLVRYWPAGKLVLHWQIGGEMQAGMLFLIHANWASYHMGWTSAQGRKAFAHGQMLWQAALRLRERGVRVLDLGDVNTDQSAGLARFKLGTGARVEPLGPTMWILP